MKILMLTASLPYPPHQGGALRSYGILHGLHEVGHQITLLSFHDSATNISVETTPLATSCEDIITVQPPKRSEADRLQDIFLSNQPDIARRLYSEEFYSHLKQLLIEKSFDLIQFEGIEVALYLLLLRRDGVQAKLCYDAFNAEAALQRVIFEVDRREPRRWPAALYSFIQSRRIAQLERDICQEADCVIAVSNEDADILRNYRADKHIPVVTNGIFSDDYATPSEQLDLGRHVLVFTGKMDYRPNVDAMVWFTGNVLPIIQERLPDTKLYIVGQKPHGRLEQLRDKNNVEITGWVQDVRPYLKAAGVYIAPLRMGSGTRLKILEAMASGCAVVATTIAVSGMRQDAQQTISVCDEAKPMADEIIRLLENPGHRQEMSAAAKAYVRQYYDWKVLIPDLLHIYQELRLE
jgi:glycosyltransferase involved in cell wall biosynthesis